jgi:hypothetical protein
MEILLVELGEFLDNTYIGTYYLAVFPKLSDHIDLGKTIGPGWPA